MARQRKMMIQRRMKLKMNPRIFMDSNSINPRNFKKEDMKSPEKRQRP